LKRALCSQQPQYQIFSLQVKRTRLEFVRRCCSEKSQGPENVYHTSD
jgi:hypothetical protein